MIFSFSISHFGEPMDTVYMDHRPRVCAYAIAWHNSLSLIEYVDCVGSRPFLGGVRKGRCCYQGAGDGTQKFLTRNPPSKPSQAASWFLSCTLGTETCQHMLPLTSFLYNMYLQHVATDLNCIVIIIIITCVYIYIYCWSNQGFLDYPGSISPVVCAMNPLATCVHNREHPPVRSSPVVRVPLLISMPQQPQQSSEERPGPGNSSAMDQALEELAVNPQLHIFPSSTVIVTRISLFNPPFALVVK